MFHLITWVRNGNETFCMPSGIMLKVGLLNILSNELSVAEIATSEKVIIEGALIAVKLVVVRVVAVRFTLRSYQLGRA